jgi:hypothetical protein
MFFAFHGAKAAFSTTGDSPSLRWITGGCPVLIYLQNDV